MKQRILRISLAVLLAMIIVTTQDLSAQIIEINGFTGYALNGTAKLYDGDFKISDAQNYGGKLAFGVSSTTFLELSYMRSDTEGRFYPYLGSPGDLVGLSSNYIQIGGLQEADLGRISTFGTVAVGLVVWSPKQSQYSSKTQFAATIGGGLKIWLTEMIGIRLQGSMLMPMVYNGVGIGCGIGTGGAGCGGNVYTRITPFQGEFSGGLTIRLSPN
ncbi:MAG: hypothetical protein ACWGNV_09060 [Bacteroidales bacterium]